MGDGQYMISLCESDQIGTVRVDNAAETVETLEQTQHADVIADLVIPVVFADFRRCKENEIVVSSIIDSERRELGDAQERLCLPTNQRDESTRLGGFGSGFVSDGEATSGSRERSFDRDGFDG